jgi:phage shock protein E
MMMTSVTNNRPKAMTMRGIGGAISVALIATTLMAQEEQHPAPANSGIAVSAQAEAQTRKSSQSALTWLTDLQQAKAQAKAQGNLRRHTAPASSAVNPGGFRNLTVDEFAQMTANKANVVLDVRTAQEFKSGHLPGALNLDVTAADFEEKAAALDKTKTYLVHCASGVRSVRACETLDHLGFPTLYNLPGGFRAWARAGRPVEK